MVLESSFVVTCVTTGGDRVRVPATKKQVTEDFD
jgi:hypothetical protein